MSSASSYFDRHRASFPARPPNTDNQRFPDETRDLSGNADVVEITVAPIPDSFTITVVSKPIDSDKYLWLIRTTDVVTALEEGQSGKATQRQRLAHTNLSGGLDAHCGGELWFRDTRHLWLNGGSSRYQAQSVTELNAAVEAFRRAGYSVCSCGWDEDTAKPARRFLGSEPWLDPK